MKSENNYIFNSDSTELTENFALKLGTKLKGGEILQLVGDIGAGKTTFVRGLVRGAGSQDHVTSPTFTISNVYDASSLKIHHYDFYRINDVAIMQSELQEVIAEPTSVAVLEWADSVNKVLPADHIVIMFKTIDENKRVLSCSIPSKFSYLRVES